ncbi:MAG TPA: hypothetical protein VK110_09885 [Salinisphaeraceae bacterium]|nr:hypothetical protein [Salinisphaeraceae bacterium]
MDTSITRWLAFCLLFGLASAAHGAIYRCEVHGETIYTDQECDPGQGEKLDLDSASEPNGFPFVTPGITDLAQSYEQRMQRSAAARTRQHAVPDVECPSEQAIAEAIAAQRVTLCMTADEVRAAQHEHNEQPKIYQRILSAGAPVLDWVYPENAAEWPVVVRFHAGHVVSFSAQLPPYYQSRQYRHYGGYDRGYWRDGQHQRRAHGHRHAPGNTKRGLYQLQLPTMIDPPSIAGYPQSRPDRLRQPVHGPRRHAPRHSHFHGRRGLNSGSRHAGPWHSRRGHTGKSRH